MKWSFLLLLPLLKAAEFNGPTVEHLHHESLICIQRKDIEGLYHNMQLMAQVQQLESHYPLTLLNQLAPLPDIFRNPAIQAWLDLFGRSIPIINNLEQVASLAELVLLMRPLQAILRNPTARTQFDLVMLIARNRDKIVKERLEEAIQIYLSAPHLDVAQRMLSGDLKQFFASLDYIFGSKSSSQRKRKALEGEENANKRQRSHMEEDMEFEDQPSTTLNYDDFSSSSSQSLFRNPMQ